MSPGTLCADDSRLHVHHAECAYRAAYPDGPDVNPLTSAREASRHGLADLSPVDIDTMEAEASARAASARTAKAHAEAQLKRAKSAQGFEALLFDTARLTALRAEQANAEKDAASADAIIRSCEAEFARRGGWPRYWLVTSSDGHVHSSMSCSTCSPTTQYVWLTEQSGLPAADLVDLAGADACTRCFPDAPVEVLARSSRLESPEAKRRRLASRSSAQKAAEVSSKGIATPDGSPLLDEGGRAFTSEGAAVLARTAAIRNVATYRAFDGHPHPDEPRWLDLVARVDAAIAAKRGRPLTDVHAEGVKRAQAAFRKEFGKPMPAVPGL